VGDRKLLTEAEAQWIAEKFLLAKYHQSQIKFSVSQIITKDGRQIYEMQGKIAMKSGGLLDRFFVDKSSNTYDFKIEVDAQQGRAINYELA
jgi:hypothetical protein